MITIQEAKQAVETADIVTFDVFDTLITRRVLHPADVFSLVGLLAKKESLINFDYRKARIQAEQKLVESKNKNSYTLNDIVDSIGKSNNLSRQTIERLYELELYAEELVTYPRKDIRDFYIELYNSGKKIVLVSDMYLSSVDIKHLLTKCGYPAAVDILVSNEISKTKADGSLWKSVFNQYDKKKTVHFGDNKHSDYDAVKKLGGKAVLIENPAEMFIESKIYETLIKYDNGEFGNSVLLGNLCNQILFNNAFSREYDEKAITGLWLGSVLSCFMRWLINNKDDSMLLFVTREGYIFRPMYLEYCRAAGVEPQKNCLFYTSRRASASACIKTTEDFEELLNSSYVDGNITELLKHRFGYKFDNDEIGNICVELPKDKKKVLKLLLPYVDDIIANSEKMRNDYCDYIDECKNGTDMSNLTIVDLGYVGRAQYYLSRITGSKISGKYLFLNPKPYPEHIGCKCECLANTADSLHPIYDNLLFLESALAVPYGQVNKLKRDDSGAVVPECGRPNEVAIQILDAQKEYIKYAVEDAEWYRLLGEKYRCPLTLTEDIWAGLLYYDYLPESYLKSFCLDDSFFGDNVWSLDLKTKEWHFGNSVTPFAFYKKNSKDYQKQKLKNHIKARTPKFLYEPLRLFWVKFIK